MWAAAKFIVLAEGLPTMVSFKDSSPKQLLMFLQECVVGVEVFL